MPLDELLEIKPIAENHNKIKAIINENFDVLHQDYILEADEKVLRGRLNKDATERFLNKSDYSYKPSQYNKSYLSG